MFYKSREKVFYHKKYRLYNKPKVFLLYKSAKLSMFLWKQRRNYGYNCVIFVNTNLPAGSAMPIPILTFVPDLLRNQNTIIQFVYKVYYVVIQNTAIRERERDTPLKIFTWKTLPGSLHNCISLNLENIPTTDRKKRHTPAKSTIVWSLSF